MTGGDKIIAEQQKVIAMQSELVRLQRDNICDLIECLDLAKPHLPPEARPAIAELVRGAKSIAERVI